MTPVWSIHTGRGQRPRLQHCSRTDAFDVQSHSIQSAARAEVERFPIGIAPGKIVRMLWRNDRPEMFALRRQNPQTTRTGNVEVSGSIHLHSVERVFARRLGHVEKKFPILE